MTELATIAKMVTDNIPSPDWTLNWRGGPVPGTTQPDNTVAPTESRVFAFQDPEGNIHRISGPATATPEEAFAILQKQLPTSPAQQRSDILDLGKAVATGLPRGIMSVLGLPGDLAKLVPEPNERTKAILAATHVPGPSDLLGPWPGTPEWRQFLSSVTGGASEWQPRPDQRWTSDLQAGAEAIPGWGKKMLLGLLSGVAGNEAARINPVGNPDAARAVGNISPVAIPILASLGHAVAHPLSGGAEIIKNLFKIFTNPVGAAINAAQPVTSAEMQYQANRRLPLPLMQGPSDMGVITGQ